MKDILKIIEQEGIIPLVKLENAADAVPLARAVLAGGISVIEITFRTDAAEDAIRAIAEEVPEITVGAGTVLNPGQADKAADAGASFIVTPGFNPSTVKHCIDRGIPVAPGISSPTQIEAALELGLNTVKFFPAEAVGGVKAIKAMSGPYGGVNFIPTGGINGENLSDYLSLPKVLACGGSWMTKGDLIKEGRFDAVTRLVAEAVDKMLGFELTHVGMYGQTAEEAEKGSGILSAMFSLPRSESSAGFMVGTGFEVTKNPYLGTHGHIAVGTNFLSRAVYYLQKRGFSIRQDSWKKKDGKNVAVYLEDEVMGFALHLLQK
ncbi:MAG: bifunctional 4-hydroxy-2-oxoglutarate aldolase/2-dehydro-3-deoxy-phosphogluconate aldolase [Spirochaetia bacterium]